ncbi:hypothetical protein [Deinococcus soli (ex Cha et al. 2016)]|uniref:Uncharacterized protein n=2 Tax=Deinococcus soli (ex Cha et al. 2016) TaxID=1309411 RepID=A0ACC6KGX6_9DEIO|nr:hypothetical protein [Deinococcus soli (ex Cha et al. 2016)]MDR6218894.1 hypothetical protein [Deinococcus soli (ex Cha et al. 2016)]MDR6328691.1 hypothetical protein [Deinococcus soli (ex Cha et al. 2016)]MDR6751822.1 hypothetical protein [Deinococcus soli (ex Cha et al. 2016)]
MNRDQERPQEVFIAFARPWFRDVRETYVVGAYATALAATEAAEAEAAHRGGKYEPEVLRAPVWVTAGAALEGVTDETLSALRPPELEQREDLYRQLLTLADTQRDRAFAALSARDAQVAALDEALDAVVALAGPLPPAVAAQVAAARTKRPGLTLDWLALTNVERRGRRLRVLGAPHLNSAGEWAVRVLDLTDSGPGRVTSVEMTLAAFSAL